MITTFKRAVVTAALAASSMTLATAAEARERRYDHGDDTAAIAIGAGIVGLAIGALLADRGDRHYYDRAYYPKRRYVSVRGHPGYYYYYDGYPNRYYRDRYYSRYYAPYYRDRYRNGYYDRRDYNRWDRGRRTYDRYYGRRDYDRNGYHRDYRKEYSRDYRDRRWRY